MRATYDPLSVKSFFFLEITTKIAQGGMLGLLVPSRNRTTLMGSSSYTINL